MSTKLVKQVLNDGQLLQAALEPIEAEMTSLNKRRRTSQKHRKVKKPMKYLKQKR